MEENLSNGKNDHQSEIVEAAYKEAEKVPFKDPVVELTFYLFFTDAAQWADDLPESVKVDESSFNKELSLFLDKNKQKIQDIEQKHNLNSGAMFLISTSLFLIKGANWARNNPPKKQ